MLRALIRLLIENIGGQPSSPEDMRSWLARNKDKIPAMQAEINKINDEYMSQFDNMQTLYHGTPNFEAISKQGFQLTKGQRSGFMGSSQTVDNLGIFLSTNKGMAQAFGQNRADLKNMKVLEVKADIRNTLNMKDWKALPLEIRKIAVKLIRDYEGRAVREPSQSDYHWLMDQPIFVNAIKDAGFDSAMFGEGKYVEKHLGASGDTVAVFEPSKLHLPQEPLSTMTDIYNHFFG